MLTIILGVILIEQDQTDAWLPIHPSSLMQPTFSEPGLASVDTATPVWPHVSSPPSNLYSRFGYHQILDNSKACYRPGQGRGYLAL